MLDSTKLAQAVFDSRYGAALLSPQPLVGIDVDEESNELELGEFVAEMLS